ncbi:Ig-like domain-containing protein [Salinisphaera sp. T31B1]|uniref:Ig-like domain-containing protein n=1 Tax=Salinisphaera sp. T31B1 TaxID=727963 RepID=UPI003340A25F
MNNKPYLAMLLLALSVSLSACGGSTSGSDSDNDSDPDPGDPTAPVAAGITLLSSTPSLPSAASSAADGTTLTAIVRDANNNVVEGQAVRFAASSGVIERVDDSTQANGTASAILYTGGNPANRTITVTANAGSESDTIDIPVVGTTLALSGPQSIAQGNQADFTATLLDSSDNAIANRAVTLRSDQGNTLSAASIDTNTQGVVRFTVTGKENGQDTITASALGATARAALAVGGASFAFSAPDDGTTAPINESLPITLTWRAANGPVVGESIRFSSSRGRFTDQTVATDSAGTATTTLASADAGPAIITASGGSGQSTSLSIQFVAQDAASLIAQADPATLNAGQSSTISATVRDANNNLVSGADVEFNLRDTSGGRIEPSQQTTNNAGRATATYTAGSSSAGDPAVITARVVGVESARDTVSVTVGGQALRITLGTGGELASQTTTYTLPYVALVTDAAGNAVSDADFQLRVQSLAFQEGNKVATDTDDDDTADTYVPRYAVTDESASDFGCPNEDVNANGILDTGEDRNGNGILEPGNVASVPRTVDLDDTGAAEFGITYPKNFSGWVKVRLRATATVQGSESTQNAFFVLPMGIDDHQVGNDNTAPPGQTSPFGMDGDCTTTFDPDTGEEP